MHTSNKNGISFGVLDLYNYRFEVGGIDPAPLFIFLKLRVRRLVSFFKKMVVLCVLSFPLLAFFSEYGTVICHFTLHNLLENLLRGNREVLTTHRLTTKKTS